jgi:hypothetical protein
VPPDLVFAPEAEDDIVVAYAWYEDRRPGPGIKSTIRTVLRTEVCSWGQPAGLLLGYPGPALSQGT